MKQLTPDQSWLLFLSKEWKKFDDVDLLYFQLFQECIFSTFDNVVESLQRVMGQTYSTKDFCGVGRTRLQKRFLKKVKRDPPKLIYLKKKIPKKMRALIFDTPVVEASHAINRIAFEQYEKDKAEKTNTPIRRTKTKKVEKVERTIQRTKPKEKPKRTKPPTNNGTIW